MRLVTGPRIFSGRWSRTLSVIRPSGGDAEGSAFGGGGEPEQQLDCLADFGTHGTWFRVPPGR